MSTSFWDSAPDVIFKNVWTGFLSDLLNDMLWKSPPNCFHSHTKAEATKCIVAHKIISTKHLFRIIIYKTQLLFRQKGVFAEETLIKTTLACDKNDCMHKCFKNKLLQYNQIWKQIRLKEPQEIILGGIFTKLDWDE